MHTPLPPEGAPSPEPTPLHKQNGAPHGEERLRLAIEEIHTAARAMGLPPVRVGWELTEDAATTALTEGLAGYMADIEIGSSGPFPDTLPQMHAPTEPDSFLVEGLIRPGTTVMLTGPPGTSKSWISRQLALACGSGMATFLDRYPIPKPLNVLVIDEDNGAGEEWRRDEVLLSAMELRRDQLSRVRRLSLAGVQLDQEHWQHWLRGQVQMYAVDLVILDPISEMHGGKELREDPAFRSLLRFLKQMKLDFPRMASVLVHHTRKSAAGDRATTRSLDDVRGQWGQTPDVVALLTNLGERRARWEIHKRMPGSTLILEAPEYGPVKVVADETTAGSRATSSENRVLSAIEAGAEDWEQVHHATGISKAQIFRIVGRLRTAQLISKDTPYRLVEETVLALPSDETEMRLA